MTSVDSGDRRHVEDFTWMDEPTFNCPYPFYEALREEAPVYKHSGPYPDYGADVFLVSRWEDIAFVTQHPEIFEQFLGAHGPLYTHRWRPPYPEAPKGRFTPWPLFYTDGVEHKVKRGYAQRLVKREYLDKHEVQVRAIANELIDDFIDRGEVELKTEYAGLYPARSVSLLVGLPREDLPRWNLRYRLWTGGGPLTEEERAAHSHLEGFGYAYEYMEQAVLERYKEPRDDLMSEIVRDQVEQDGGLDLNWQVIFWSNLPLAGSGTTVTLLMNFFGQLGNRPDVLDRLRADPSLVRPAIEESLRLEAPVHHLPRIARVDTELGGVKIPAGSVVALLYASGNHDPERWECPAEFDLDRSDVRKNTLSFGRGVHLCVGAPLGRWTGEIGVQELLRRTRNIRIDEERSDTSKNPPESQPKKLVLTFDRA